MGTLKYVFNGFPFFAPAVFLLFSFGFLFRGTSTLGLGRKKTRTEEEKERAADFCVFLIVLLVKGVVLLVLCIGSCCTSFWKSVSEGCRRCRNRVYNRCWQCSNTIDRCCIRVGCRLLATESPRSSAAIVDRPVRAGPRTDGDVGIIAGAEPEEEEAPLVRVVRVSTVSGVSEHGGANFVDAASDDSEFGDEAEPEHEDEEAGLVRRRTLSNPQQEIGSPLI